MEILQNFGVNPILLGAQIVNFLLIFFLLKKFLYKPLLQTMQERKKRIADGLKYTTEAEERLAKIKEEEAKILKTAQTQAQKMLTETKEQTQEMLKTSQDNARKQTEKMLSEAKAQIDEEARRAEKRLAQTVNALALQYLEKSIGELFTEKEQQSVMEKALKKLEKKTN